MDTLATNEQTPREQATSQDGLSEAEAAAALAALGPPPRPASSRSYGSIVRANALTVFNVILATFGAVTLLFGDARDALFVGVIIANTSIGIAQEVRAKRALDRLALLVAPRASVLRDGSEREVAVDAIVPGDLVRVRAGDQIVADGDVVAASELHLDESVLTGESDAVARAVGEEIHSGAFVAEGTGSYRVSAVREHSFAAKIVGEARSFRHPRSPLEQAVNRLLYALVAAMLLLGGVLGFSLYHRHVARHEAVATSVAGVVSLIPEGLMVLVSLTYAVAAAKMARRGVLAQQLNAIESLASVEVICVDKTGTLTEAALRVADLEPADGSSQEELARALGRLAASTSSRNGTIAAIAEAYPAEAELPSSEVPFSSRRRWSAVQLADATYLLGAPERFALGPLGARARELASSGRRVLALARSDAPLAAEHGDSPPQGARPLGLVAIAERLRPNVAETIAFLLAQGVEIKVLSGDSPRTVAAIARDVGIPVATLAEGAEIPEDPTELRAFALRTTVVGRISPEGKRAIVGALSDAGRYVAMLGDGVNDVPALKAARLAIAQGSGAQMARSIADLVLVRGDFDAIPALIHEGRQALRNLQRVSKLYVTKSAFAAFLILTIGITSEAYPLLPRHLSLVASLAIGIPTFFLALAPSSGPWRPQGFAQGVARFAVPAGVILGTGTVAGYLFALHDLDYPVTEARTVAATVLLALGLYLVIALEATGSLRRSSLVGAMCAALAGVYAVVLATPALRHFFQLSAPTVGMLATAAVATLLSIVALVLAGYVPSTAGAREARAAA
jgi:magnesium-transporting ATPase (P-type)